MYSLLNNELMYYVKYYFFIFEFDNANLLIFHNLS